MVVANTGCSWHWTYPPLCDRGKDGRYIGVAEDGVAVGQTGVVIVLEASVSPSGGSVLRSHVFLTQA
jgi:hypothetical protein